MKPTPNTRAVKAGLTLEGGDKLARTLAELPKRIEGKATRAALNAAAVPMLKGAKAHAPRTGTGMLRAALGKKVKASKRQKGTMNAIVGPRRRMGGVVNGRMHRPTKYNHLVIGGTRAHGGHPGTSANDYLNRAFAQQAPQAKDKAAKKYQEVIEREARKLGKA